MQTNREVWHYSQAVKKVEVEEPIDLWFHRRIAFALLRPFEHHFHSVTPIHLTAASAFVGVLGSLCCLASVYLGSHWLGIAGLMLFASTILDCADGMLARLRGTASSFGQMADIFGDHVVGLTFWFSMCYAITFGWEYWWVWPANLAILVSIMIHVAIYDQFKEFYLSKVSSDHSPRPEKPKQEISGFERGMSAYYKQAYPGVFHLVGGGGRAAAQLSGPEFEEAFRRPMRLISYLGLGTHLFLVYMIALISIWIHDYTFLVAQIMLTGLMNMWCVVSVWYWRWTDKDIMKRTAGRSGSSQKALKT